MHIHGYAISRRFPPRLAHRIEGAYRAQSVMLLFVLVDKSEKPN
ncbi:hypothetical protein PPTG_24733 [Phytophthora nicotianae INRA-310]|uniref:Uncharacterized protein n=1 Tax=Phytophthora nicotianae (strain INRA-310) TaxID=761204 RepID=W2PB70_PHYN3|nr:hypothetical protein PPTG_24733 [Phytophthora nicotianae INRA-310]ETM98081.1 hypothetical protein PPTG_24733 [Phytophthora nicotianae INRA-310]